MKITLKQLKDARACEDQRKLFEQTFGQSVEVTEELCRTYAQKFDFSWASVRLLNDNQRKAYDEACASYQKAFYKAIAPHEKAYREAVDSHEKAYFKACASYQKAYNKAVDSHEKAYDKACASQRKTYYEAMAPHQKAYYKAIAIAFAKAYNGEI